MLFNKKDGLSKSESIDQVYDIILDDYSFYFIDKKASCFITAETTKDFYKGLIATKLKYFSRKGHIENLCSKFALSITSGKKETKKFIKNCNKIICIKKEQLKDFSLEQ